MLFSRSRIKLLVFLVAIAGSFLVSLGIGAQGQRARQTPPMDITEYSPKSNLVVPEHPKPRAKYPFIDIHSHHGQLSPPEVAKLLGEMDSINLRVINNLSGGTG